jgi:hypothetical protein
MEGCQQHNRPRVAVGARGIVTALGVFRRTQPSHHTLKDTNRQRSKYTVTCDEFCRGEDDQ